MTSDAKKLSRKAQPLVVEARTGSGSPPSYQSNWEIVWGAKVDRIDIKKDAAPSVATIWFPGLRWHETPASPRLKWGDMIRVRTDDKDAEKTTTVFSGFITSFMSDFSGGTGEPGTAYERTAITCMDYRWLLMITCPLFGQIVRGPDDYESFGTKTQLPIADSYITVTGRRAIFNAEGQPNKDPVTLTVIADDGVSSDMPIFADPLNGVYWTARDMIYYILNPLNNKSYKYFPIPDPSKLKGLEHADWKKMPSDVIVDGLNIVEAIHLVAKQIGWGFREDYDAGGNAILRFYKTAAAVASERDVENDIIIIKQQLHSPAKGDNLKEAVTAGKKICWAANISEDIAAVINAPIGIGALQRFEFTAELVPAWLDADLVPDTSEGNANLFFSETDIRTLTDPELKTFFKYYHTRGSQFRRDVGRRWSLNETGKYSSSPAWTRGKFYKAGDMVSHTGSTYRCLLLNYSIYATAPGSDFWEFVTDDYDRGMPFDFRTVIDAKYLLEPKTGKRLYAPFGRQLLAALTTDKNTLNSVGIRVEFSFDAGSTWQLVPASIISLKDECGIQIEERNLSEISPITDAAISADTLAGVDLNYWSSLCDDKLNTRVFKDGDWHTRVRVTASVQLDQRLFKAIPPTPDSGSPFHHSQLYDFSEKYGIQKRMPSSINIQQELPSHDYDMSEYFDKHMESVRDANQDMSISGQFTLDRLWLGDGEGEPDFAIGDCVEKITGREYPLGNSINGVIVYPEIIEIIYLPEQQKMKLITRDLRFSEIAML